MLVHISGWPQFMSDGEAYLRCATQALAKGRVAFTPTILYNLTAMAIEKFIMAYLMYHGDLAQNHTMLDLSESLERHLGPQPELRTELHFIGTFQEICDQDSFRLQPPSIADLERMLGTARRLRDLVRDQIH